MKYNDMQRRRNFNRDKIIPALRSAGQDKLADDLAYCGTWINVAECKDCHTKHFAGVCRCKSRFCSICARTRADAWLVKLVPLLQDYIRQGYFVFFATFTIKNQPELKTALEALGKAWRYMTHEDKTSREAWAKLNSGGVRSTEVKLGENSGLWHPHIHALVLYKFPEGVKRVKQFADYRKLWEKATRYAFDTTEKVGSVDVRGLKDLNGKGGIVPAVIETFKYIAKSNWTNISSEQVNELVGETHGKRFTSAWGELYRLNKQVEELLARTPAEEIRGRACQVCGCTEFELDRMMTEVLPKGMLEFE